MASGLTTLQSRPGEELFIAATTFIAAAVNEFATRVPRKAVANASTSSEGGSK